MTDENKLIRDTSRAVRARELLENELLTEAFATLESAYVAAWRSSSVDNVDGREKVFLAINIIGKVREHLIRAVMDGKIAQAELDLLDQQRTRRARGRS